MYSALDGFLQHVNMSILKSGYRLYLLSIIPGEENPLMIYNRFSAVVAIFEKKEGKSTRVFFEVYMPNSSSFRRLIKVSYIIYFVGCW